MPSITLEFKNHLKVSIDYESFNLAAPRGEDEVSADFWKTIFIRNHTVRKKGLIAWEKLYMGLQGPAEVLDS